MTETDAIEQPIYIPENFAPYLEKHRIYQLFKDILRDMVLHMPEDPLKHMKTFLVNQTKGGKDTHRIILLVSPEITIDKKNLVQEIIKHTGFAAITRSIVMDFLMKHNDYVKGCVSPVLQAQVTKGITLKEPVAKTGWIMMDQPCSLREARCLQQEGVLPSVTLMLVSPPTSAEAVAPRPTPPTYVPRLLHQQDITALRHLYKATLKEVIVNPGEPIEDTVLRCFSAIRAASEGAQGPSQGYHMLGSPAVYRILLLGPRGSGRRTQARLISKLFDLVHLNFRELYHEASIKKDNLAKRLSSNGPEPNLITEIINRRILEKDCIEQGWIMTSYPEVGMNIDILENVNTPPNRIIFLNVDWETCKARMLARRVDWCTGHINTTSDGDRDKIHPNDQPETAERDVSFHLDFYFMEALLELRTAAGMMATHIDASLSIEQVQVQMQTAIMATAHYDVEKSIQMKNASATMGLLHNTGA